MSPVYFAALSSLNKSSHILDAVVGEMKLKILSKSVFKLYFGSGSSRFLKNTLSVS